MNQSNDYTVIIIGGGPAGLATALHLAQQAPHLAEDMLILEAKDYPRPKVCGGGVTFHGEEQLEQLGITIDVPSFYIHRLDFRYGKHVFRLDYENAMRIIHRAEFDAALARAAEERNLPMHTGERLLDVRPYNGGVELETNRGCYRTTVVVAADGAKSTVRRKLKLFSTVNVARLLRVMTPVDVETNKTWQEHTAVFDFSCIKEGIQGYTWDFPCYIGGKPYMNRGIFDSRILDKAPQRGNLKQTFMNELDAHHVDLTNVPLEGHPVRWFNPQADFAQPHVLFAGDAAGVDPLFAEGISYAMEYGEAAAETIQHAFAQDDFSFTDYRPRLLKHKLGHSLKRRAWVARTLYERRPPAILSAFWQLASVSHPAMKRAVGTALHVLPTT